MGGAGGVREEEKRCVRVSGHRCSRCCRVQMDCMLVTKRKDKRRRGRGSGRRGVSWVWSWGESV